MRPNPAFLSKPWFGFVVLMAFMLVGAKVWSDHTAEKAAKAAAFVAAREAAQVAAIKATDVAQNIAAAQLRSGCGRTQRANAYFRLRAQEFREGDNSPSLTTKIAPQIFPIIYCERSYAPGYKGLPVLLDGHDAACFIHLVKLGYFNASTARQPYTDPVKLRRVCALVD